MKVFAIAIVVVLTLIGATLFAQLEYEQTTTQQVEDYVKSRGKAPVPFTWRGKIGEGI